MGKPRKTHRQPRFQYDRNRSKEWKNSKKLPTIECKQIKKAWIKNKSVEQNMRLMGLSSDPNITLKVPSIKQMLDNENKKTQKKEKNIKQTTTVIKELEEEASIPPAKTLQLSEPLVRYCVCMLESYGEDYKAMAKDRKNYYQDTPKQIKRKINSFKNTPDVVQQVDNESTPEKVVVDMAARTRKPTRKYIAKRRNGHYTSPAVKATKTCSSEVPLHKVKRKLHFGRKPPIQREKANNSKKNRERSQSPTKKQTFGKVAVKRKKISKELLDLLDMADHFIYSEKLRSKNLKRPCHGDHGIPQGTYKLHSSHEVTNLSPGRQN
ncbi:uncharacterized protein LOC134716388 [Mytilus trossulus]|uniref:uncharacterized protein LOC134716388 n=1 Tax=Mytilus trossulus TaxID=6551 RepID=UPI0030069E9E